MYIIIYIEFIQIKKFKYIFFFNKLKRMNIKYENLLKETYLQYVHKIVSIIQLLMMMMFT
jgi:hypothetical protein